MVVHTNKALLSTPRFHRHDKVTAIGIEKCLVYPIWLFSTDLHIINVLRIVQINADNVVVTQRQYDDVITKI